MRQDLWHRKGWRQERPVREVDVRSQGTAGSVVGPYIASHAATNLGSSAVLQGGLGSGKLEGGGQGGEG